MSKEITEELIETESKLEDVKLDSLPDPVVLTYCQVCLFPEEYCEYSHPVIFKKVSHQVEEVKKEADKVEEVVPSETKEVKEPKKSKKDKPENKIMIELSNRGKRKHVTQVFNMENYGLNLKDVAKLFSKKFACSSTVTKEDNGKEGITLTGEFGYEIVDFLTEKFPQIKPEMCQVKEPKSKK